MGNRLIHFEKDVWIYRVGNQYVKIRSPYNKSFSIGIDTILGICPDDFERAIWKGYYTGVKPSDVKKYIENNLK